MVDIELEVCCTLWGGEGRLQMRGSGRSVCLQGAGQTAAGGGAVGRYSTKEGPSHE
jgi:hypothetical protein